MKSTYESVSTALVDLPEMQLAESGSVRFDATRAGLLSKFALIAGLIANQSHPTPWTLPRTRRDDVANAESSTQLSAVDPLLLAEVRDIFRQGSKESFEDGSESNFSRRLLAFLAEQRRPAFKAVSKFLMSGAGSPDTVAETLKWLSDYQEILTLNQRWGLLERGLMDESPRVRASAVLGFSAIGASHHVGRVLSEARRREQDSQICQLIDHVLESLAASRQE